MDTVVDMLLAALQEDPDDVAAWMALVDELHARGDDPRAQGLLIGILALAHALPPEVREATARPVD